MHTTFAEAGKDFCSSRHTNLHLRQHSDVSSKTLSRVSLAPEPTPKGV